VFWGVERVFWNDCVIYSRSPIHDKHNIIIILRNGNI
jgi:hypothetical protein